MRFKPMSVTSGNQKQRQSSLELHLASYHLSLLSPFLPRCKGRSSACLTGPNYTRKFRTLAEFNHAVPRFPVSIPKRSQRGMSPITASNATASTLFPLPQCGTIPSPGILHEPLQTHAAIAGMPPVLLGLLLDVSVHGAQVLDVGDALHLVLHQALVEGGHVGGHVRHHLQGGEAEGAGDG